MPIPTPPSAPVHIITDAECALVLLKEPRRRILELARRPVTAVEMAAELDETRQRIGYHVRQLVGVGLLSAEEGARRGAMVEKRYRASANSYGLSPDLLGPLAARLSDPGDRESLLHLVGAVHEVQTDLAEVLGASPEPPERLPTLTLSTQLRLTNAAARAAFADALVRALTEVVGKHASAFSGTGSSEPLGDPFRLTVTLHPTIP